MRNRVSATPDILLRQAPDYPRRVGAGRGAGHQTGCTGVGVQLIEFFGPQRVLEVGKEAGFPLIGPRAGGRQAAIRPEMPIRIATSVGADHAPRKEDDEDVRDASIRVRPEAIATAVHAPGRSTRRVG